MKRRTVTLAFVVAMGGLALAALASGRDDFMAALLRARSDVRWDRSTLVEGDFKGDGIVDAAIVGYSNSGLVLAVGTAAKPSKIQYLNFGINAGEQAAICAAPARLLVVPLSCEQDDVGKLPGCVASPHASGLTIDDNQCDPINLYWDHDQRRLTWWRN